MKRQLKTIAAFAIISAMTMVSVISVNAQEVTEGTNNVFVTRNKENGETIVAQLTFSKTPLAGKKMREKELPMDDIDGYEWKYVYMYRDIPHTDYMWDLNIENSKDWRGLDYIEEGDYHIEYFTVTDNNIDFTECINFSVSYSDSSYMCMRVPKGYKGKMSLEVWPVKIENGKRVPDKTTSLVFSFNDDDMLAQQSVPAWKQDAMGWRVENPDGSYLISTWYQSPASGLWYYMGADGYMLTNTITPDGYAVNADGVWIQ